MVDGWTGHWYEENDYINYQKEEMCLYDYMAIEIRNRINIIEYKIKTDMEHLIDMILMYAESYNNEVYEDEDEKIDLDNPFDIVEWAIESGGFESFDYYV